MSGLHERPAELLRDLVRFATINPPGNEAECIGYIGRILEEAGIPWHTVARNPSRPNLIARLPGQGSAPPLLLQGHADVVPVEGQNWTHPPFEAVIEDGCIWGRGTLDMKGGLTMMITALLKARAEGFVPAGDIILAVLSDEEAGGDDGARFLADSHPGEFENVRYAVGEVGGYSTTVEGRRFYPVQVTEKQVCWLRTVLEGPGGHGSMPMRDGTMAQLGRLLTRLNGHAFPVHITDATRQMVERLAANLPEPSASTYASLLDPSRTDQVLLELGDAGKGFHPLLHNTVNATMVKGGTKINVIPSQIEICMDCRLLPGFSPQDAIGEIREVVGEHVEFEVTRFDPVPARQDMGMFGLLEGILKDLDSRASAALPFLVPGGTDARHFSRLGIQTYGFTPMILPEGQDLLGLAHAADERISLEALAFGVEAMYMLLQRYGRED
ncbi:M20/M25/M40 family metallo-hydrolase [Candidatus Fermentibacterales bacterium]|nr:M20/M25/M40 family metallo-hydrolase [Candidatus Fermentibacterales bacterium]